MTYEGHVADRCVADTSGKRKEKKNKDETTKEKTSQHFLMWTIQPLALFNVTLGAKM
jgi:hypothetical protein